MGLANVALALGWSGVMLVLMSVFVIFESRRNLKLAVSQNWMLTR